MSSDDARRPGELTARELARYGWRQLTSMRTALILLLVLALAAIPGSVIPQQGVDALKTSNWKSDHTTLTPIYEKLDLFAVYSSPWFAAIYILLMVSLVGCIVPRTLIYLRAIRAVPPAAPRNLDRLPDSLSFTTELSPDEVLDRARRAMRRRHYRLRPDDLPSEAGPVDAISGERGRLREVGNLLFHLSVIVVLVGFAIGSLFGFKGGVIVYRGSGFSNTLIGYDDFVPGSLFDTADLEPFHFSFDDFDIDWLSSGPRAGLARGFQAHLTYEKAPGAAPRTYDLEVNHPLSIGDTELFLIGHGYAPVITVRDGEGNIAYSGPTVFLPLDSTFASFGVVKASAAAPTQIGLEGEFFPTYGFTDATGPFSLFGDDLDPAISMTVWTGDLGMDSGASQSIYVLDKANATQLKKAERAGGPRRPPQGSVRRPPGPPGQRQLRRRRTVGEDPDQSLAGQAHRTRWCDPRSHRPARLVVHPAATSLGSRPQTG